MSDREIREAERRCLDDPDDLDADLHRIALLRRAHRLPFRRIHTAARLLDPVALQVVAPAVTRPIHMAVDPLGTPWLRPNAIDRATHPLRIVERAALALHVVESCIDSPLAEAFARPFVHRCRVWIRRPILQHLRAVTFDDPPYPLLPLFDIVVAAHAYIRISRSPSCLLQSLRYLAFRSLRPLLCDLLLLRPRSVYARILRDPPPKGPAP